jgi:hypothetical protein
MIAVLILSISTVLWGKCIPVVLFSYFFFENQHKLRLCLISDFNWLWLSVIEEVSSISSMLIDQEEEKKK